MGPFGSLAGSFETVWCPFGPLSVPHGSLLVPIGLLWMVCWFTLGGFGAAAGGLAGTAAEKHQMKGVFMFCMHVLTF